MATFTDTFKFLVTADGTQAVQGFKKVEAASRSTSDKVAKDAQSLSQRFGQKLDGIAQKSPMVQKALGSIGVSAQQLGATLPTVIGAGAVAAGGAIATFAVQGIKKFQDTALAAGKLADATGLNVEAASRWLEVSGDIGISGDTVRGTFVKMEKAIATNRDAFGSLVKTGKDGSVDLSKTFLATAAHLQGIRDPIDRANEASRLFGKGFSEVSELISMKADDLQKRLDSVSKQKVITEAELKRARDFRDAMDNLHDTGEDLSITLGQALIPTVTGLGNAAATALGPVGELQTVLSKKWGPAGGISLQEAFVNPFSLIPRVADAAYGKVRDFFDLNTTKSGVTITAIEKIAGAYDRTFASADAAEASIIGLNAGYDRQFASADAAEASINGVNAALDRQAAAYKTATDATTGYLSSQHGVDSAELAQVNALDAANAAMLEAVAAKGKDRKANLEAKVAYDEVIDRTIDLKNQQLALFGIQPGTQRANKATADSLRDVAKTASGPLRAALLDAANRFDEIGKKHPNPTVSVNDQASPKIPTIQRTINSLAGKAVTVTLNANTSRAQQSVDAFIQANMNRNVTVQVQAHGTFPHQAAGGPVRAGQPTIVGEKGWELFVPAVNGRIVPHVDSVRMRGLSPPARSGSSGVTVVQNFNGPVLGSALDFGRYAKQAIAAADRVGIR